MMKSDHFLWSWLEKKTVQKNTPRKFKIRCQWLGVKGQGGEGVRVGGIQNLNIFQAFHFKIWPIKIYFHWYPKNKKWL